MNYRPFFVNLTLLLFVLVFAGCNGNSTKPKEIAPTPREKTKAQLLRRVNSRFTDPQAHYQLGKIYQSEGLLIQAEKEFNTALSFDPVHRKAQAARVRVLLDLRDTTQSQQAAKFYMSQAATLATASLELGMAFQQERLDDYALACYNQALKIAPTSARVNKQLGLYYLSKNDMDKGKDYLIRSFQLNPNQPDVAKILGSFGIEVRAGQKTQEGTQSPEQTR